MTSLICIRWCFVATPATITGISLHAGLDAARAAIITMQTNHPGIRPDINDPEENKAGGYEIPADHINTEFLKRLQGQGDLYFLRDPESGHIKDPGYKTHLVPLFQKAGGIKNFPLTVIGTGPQRKRHMPFLSSP